MKVTALSSRQLRRLVRKEAARCLVLDCRPYLSFAASCLRGSLNVNLNSVVLRRARGGAVPLHFAVPDEAARGRLLLGREAEEEEEEDEAAAAQAQRLKAVVVLDQGTRHWRKLKGGSTAQIVLNTLLAALPEPGAKVCFLKGGYETFYSQYPEFCIDVKPISQEKPETERSGNSLSEKQWILHKPAYDQGGPVEILPFLYLGSAYHASKYEFLANLNITALLNVSRKSSEPFTGQYCYKWIPVEDSHTADISSHFQEAIEFIDCTRREGGKILVHCEAGISRSPTICMAYLMKMKKFRLEEAFDYIKQRRSLISPNFGFMGQLLQYEAEILSSTPSPSVSSCKRDAVSFFAEELTRSKSFEGSCFAFPTSVLNSVPLHSPVHQLKLNPITATSPCWTILGTRDNTVP
ncbi:dual specificity protein phosphatase 5 [Anolis carolinensis]|uniref:Dual specificity protein phosphatase n=1 Tax=Anolis carolinensis TaxID=28377 RepID=G1KEU8_ANOCA|nr:PREDICTED: dual specificity protein phosphatase 5 [Anolis carolinensis]|eukprot:XP_003218549.1 PREDICTED: dual specificity protein phosphatase 5 [Anolis carolinensis]